MKTLLSKLILLCNIVWLTNASAANEQANQYKAFGHLPMVELPQVSPDGKHVVAVLNSDNGPSVVVSGFASTELANIARLKKSKDRIDDVVWVNNERILVFASYSKLSSLGKSRIHQIFAVNIDGSNMREIKRRKTKQWSEWKEFRQEIYLKSTLKDDKEHVLLQMYDERDGHQSVFKVNVYTSKFSKQIVNKYHVSSWYADSDDVIRFGVGHDEAVHNNTLDMDKMDLTHFWYRASEQDDWRIIHTYKAYQGATFSPIGSITSDNKIFVFSDRETGRKALWLYDIATGKFEKRLFGHEKYDVRGAILNVERSKVIGVYYFDDYKVNHFFNQQDSKTYQLVKKSFAKFQTSIYSRSKDGKKLLVLASSNNSPDKFYWLDLTKRSGGFWFSQYPYLEGQTLGSTQPYQFTTADGMELNGYLTLPATSKVNKQTKPPLIVFPHGGPIGPRDYQYFDPYVQFFSQLGYAVLQVNFRGSGGFGNDYLTAGYRQWGKLMQQDVYQAIDWLTEQKIVDTSNACLVGASYGGYVALTAAFQRPKQFKCIASIAGISDLFAMVENDYLWYSRRTWLKMEVGDHTQDDVAKEFQQLSAINNLDKIKAPILLIHGKNDTRVNYRQSADFYDEAKSAGLAVEYVEFKYGTHFLDENDNRLAAFKALESFLKQHL